MNHQTSARTNAFVYVLLIAGLFQMVGCEVDSFFDPSKTGRFEMTATTVPVLDRLDVIEEEEDLWGETSPVSSEDLIPNDLTYRMVPGDVVSVGIYELVAERQWSTITRRVDQAGNLRVPGLGDLQAAGYTAQEFEERIIEILVSGQRITNPQVQASIEEGGGFNYTIYGFIASPGVFNLLNPDLRLLDALAIAGGIPLTTKRIYVVRDVPLSDDIKPAYDRRAPSVPSSSTPTPPADIEDLINQLDDGAPIQPGAFMQDSDPPIDIDDLNPEPPVDIDAVRPGLDAPSTSFIYVQERDEWVPVRGGSNGSTMVNGSSSAEEDPGKDLVLERVLEIPYQRLSHGDNSYNIVIRPNDRIYVDGPASGLIYIDGEITRPGVYNLPTNSKLTLSRLIAVAGGLNPIAIPERVDLTRVVGAGEREATVRLNLAAIRQRTEPDIMLKPDDHIIIGTNFLASPLAVIRNGFRATYGFGFLLDRNFGNDVFGAPPSNVGRNN